MRFAVPRREFEHDGVNAITFCAFRRWYQAKIQTARRLALAFTAFSRKISVAVTSLPQSRLLASLAGSRVALPRGAPTNRPEALA